MKKLMTVAAMALATAWTAAAATPAKATTSEDPAAKAARIAEKKRTMLGPKVVKPGSLKGTIAVLTAQKSVDEDDFRKALGLLQKPQRFNTAVKSVAAPASGDLKAYAKLKADAGVEVAVIVVDDAELPACVAAPEDQWAVVNVAKLAAQLPEGDALKKRLLAGRARREVMRALAHICGGIGSQFENNMVGAVKVEELDAVNEFVPVDVMNRMTTYLEKIGVTPAYERFYYQACKEGWAPAPTSDIEKSIAARVQELKERGPTNPILIKPKKAK